MCDVHLYVSGCTYFVDLYLLNFPQNEAFSIFKERYKFLFRPLDQTNLTVIFLTISLFYFSNRMWCEQGREALAAGIGAVPTL